MSFDAALELRETELKSVDVMESEDLILGGTAASLGFLCNGGV